jgi:soluble lytic murein transglycosylase-like protein
MELMLAIISYESSFVSSAISDESTASGYCQIVRNTAEYIYENVIDYGEYDVNNHEYIMTTDWELNLELGCALMRYNRDQNWSWDYAIYDYHGSSDETENADYFQYINTRLYKLFGISVCDLT